MLNNVNKLFQEIYCMYLYLSILFIIIGDNFLNLHYIFFYFCTKINIFYFLNTFFINRRKKIKSNKNIKILIDEKIANKRYEDLTYTEILDIYKRFNFSFS